MEVVKGQERDVEVAVAFPRQREVSGLTEQLERMWGVMTPVAPALSGGSGDVNPQQRESPQQISGTTFEISDQKNAALGTVGFWLRASFLMKWMSLIFKIETMHVQPGLLTL